MRLIDADALKDKLQQHHDFYVMAWGGFGKMPIGEKKRVDEITNCIAEVVNAPTIDAVSVVHGEWIPHPTEEEWDVCTACGTGCKRREIGYDTYFERTYVTEYGYPFCPNCGAKMDGERREP